METTELLVPNNIIFCEKHWKIAAALLSIVTFMTFMWGFVILNSFLDEYDFEDYSISTLDGGMFGMINTAGDNTKLQRLVSPAVVSIVTIDQLGKAQIVSSGVIIHPDGYVLSTLHGINGQKRVVIQIQTADGPRRYQIKIIKTHQPHDLVLLKMVTNDRFLFVKLADSQMQEMNSPVMTLGKDANGATLTTSGLLVQKNIEVKVGEANLQNLLHSDSPATWQQGGGPMINSNAEMIGLNIVINQTNGIETYAIPADVIKVHFQDVIKFAGTQSQQQTNSGQNSTTAPLASVSSVAASWWGKARDLQIQENQSTSMLNDPSLNTSPNVFSGMGLNIATTNNQQNNTPVEKLPQQAPTPMADNPQLHHIGTAGDMVTLIDLEHKTSFNLGGFRLDAMFGLALLGLVGGIVGAFMPMGGSIVVVTGMMIFFSYGLFLIRPVIYVSNLFTYGIPAFRFMQKGLTMKDRLYPLFVWIAVGVLLGFFIGHNMSDHFVGYLLGIFSLALAAVALHDLHEIDEPSAIVTTIKPKSSKEAINVFLENLRIENKEDKNANMLQSAIMGAPLGFLTGLIGVSGGLLEIFYQRRFAGISFNNALANSAVMVFVASLTAAVVSFLYGTSIGVFAWQTPLTLAMIIVPCAFAGGILGHRLCERLTKQQQRYAFVAVMTIIALTMLFRQ